MDAQLACHLRACQRQRQVPQSTRKRPLPDVLSEAKRCVNIRDLARWLGIEVLGHKSRCISPDHPDKHPSLSFHTRADGTGAFTCFACGIKGDSLDLIQIVARVSFGDAFKVLCNRAGISISSTGRRRPHTSDAARRKQENERHFRVWERRAHDMLLTVHRVCFQLVGRLQGMLHEAVGYGLMEGEPTRDTIEAALASFYTSEQRAELHLDTWEEMPEDERRAAFAQATRGGVKWKS